MVWFTNDLRVDDNSTLLKASQTSSTMLCVFVVDPAWFAPNGYGLKSMGDHRWQFLYDSLMDLKAALNQRDQKLLIKYGSPHQILINLAHEFQIDTVYRSANVGFYENQQWKLLQQRLQAVNFVETTTHTLFSEQTLPVDSSYFNSDSSFSRFRKRIETFSIEAASSAIGKLPPPPLGLNELNPMLPHANRMKIQGFAQAAQPKLKNIY